MTMMMMTMINGSNQNFWTKRTSTRTRNRTLFFAVVLLLSSSSPVFAAPQINFGGTEDEIVGQDVFWTGTENENVGTCVPNGFFCGNYSVARVIENQNTALGNYGTCGGGERNTAGSHNCTIRVTSSGRYRENCSCIAAYDEEEEEEEVPIHVVDYTVIGGGTTNLNTGTKATISGGRKNRIHYNRTNVAVDDAIDPAVANQYSVISGGRLQNQYEGIEFEYATTGSVITGGVENFWEGTKRNPQMTISGGRYNIAKGRQTVVSGGQDNVVYGTNSVILGGNINEIWDGANFGTIPGGNQNHIRNGNYSIALGQRAHVNHTNTMVINLQGNTQPVNSTAAGQFLVQAKSFRFQVTNDPGAENQNVFILTAENIQFLQNAIDTPPPTLTADSVNWVTRHLQQKATDDKITARRNKREHDYERRQRKLQRVREHYL